VVISARPQAYLSLPTLMSLLQSSKQTLPRARLRVYSALSLMIGFESLALHEGVRGALTHVKVVLAVI
jgi:hypothetical protein